MLSANAVVTAWVRKYSLPLFLVSAVLGVFSLGTILGARYHAPKVSLAGNILSVTVADTPQTRSQGLSDQAGLTDHEAMLFIHDQPEISCFWMKDMRFAIDILWFDASGTLIYEKLHADPASYPESYCPPVAATHVVEVRAGWAKAHGITHGAQLKLH